MIYKLGNRLAGPLRALPRHGQELTDVCSACSTRRWSFYFNNKGIERAGNNWSRICADPLAGETSCKNYRYDGPRVDPQTGEEKWNCKK